MYIFSPVFTCSANHFKPPFNPLSFIFITSAQHKSYCVHRSGATDGWDCLQMKRTTFKCFDNYKETSGQFPAGFADDRSRYFFLAKTWCFFPNQLGFVPQPSQRIINPLPWHKKKKENWTRRKVEFKHKEAWSLNMSASVSGNVQLTVSSDPRLGLQKAAFQCFRHIHTRAHSIFLLVWAKQ